MYELLPRAIFPEHEHMLEETGDVGSMSYSTFHR